MNRWFSETAANRYISFEREEAYIRINISNGDFGRTNFLLDSDSVKELTGFLAEHLERIEDI